MMPTRTIGAFRSGGLLVFYFGETDVGIMGATAYAACVRVAALLPVMSEDVAFVAAEWLRIVFPEGIGSPDTKV